jgi:hypothetical protein
MAHPKKPVQPRDFMPSEWSKIALEKKPKRRRRQLIADELRASMKNFMGQNG